MSCVPLRSLLLTRVQRLANAGRGLGDADLAEMDTLWDQAKVQGY